MARPNRSLLSILILSICLYSCSRPSQQSQATRIDTLLSILNDPNTESVLVVAHRGGWRNTVENSFESLQNAIDMGVDVVELDVRRTADSILILMHDATIDRTTNGKGKVSELSIDSIRNCFLKANDSTITDLQVPTLEEIFIRSKGHLMLNIDKGYNMFDEIMALAAKTGVTRQIIMKGGQDAEHVRATAGPYLDSVIYMPIVNLDKEGAEATIAVFDTTLHPVAYELLFKSDTSRVPQRIRDFLASRSLIWYNTMWNGMSGERYDDQALDDATRVYGYLIDSLNARLIQTDRPKLLLEYLRKCGRHD